MNDIKVSVCCFTYNHAPYLSKALDSVLSQKTNFRYEIIIGDDCSTDGSQDIINAYAIKFPDLIKTIYQPVNSRGKKNFSDVYKSAEGQYVIALETDDYWTDPNKLQIQVDYLDRHPACIAVAHNCVVVDEHDRQLARKYPAIDQGVYRYKHFTKGLMPGQTTTVLYRNPKFVENLDMSLYNNPISGPGDSRRLFCLMTAGDVITLPYTMSAYRYVTSRGKKNFSDVYKSAEGQYVIALETDDYWTDPNKLQIQVDYLDRHPACIAVAHNCVVVDEHDRQLARKYPAIDQGVYRYKHFTKGLMPGQTTTVLYRNPKFVENLDMSLYNNPISGPGDSRRLFCLMTAGDVITLPYTMSAYRYVTSGGYSFSANHKRDDKSALLFFREFQIYADKFTNKPMRLAADVRLMQVALGALKHRQIDLKEWIQYYRSCQFPFKALICAAAKIIQHKLNRNN